MVALDHASRPASPPTTTSTRSSTFDLDDGGGTIHTEANITGEAASVGEGLVATVLDALIKDFTTKPATI
jgi:hypothetical protein